jgi:hypothetical protein
MTLLTAFFLEPCTRIALIYLEGKMPTKAKLHTNSGKQTTDQTKRTTSTTTRLTTTQRRPEQRFQKNFEALVG